MPTVGKKTAARPVAAPAKKAVSKATASRRTRDDDDDDDDDERPRKAVAATKKGAQRALPSGFGGYNQQKKASGDFAPYMEITQDEQAVKFLDDEPVVSWREHWIERSGKKSWFCYQTLDEDCPICDATGDRARTSAAWNVLVLDPKGNHQLVVLKQGIKKTEQLKEYNADVKVGPLSGKKRYWAISKTGKGQRTEILIRPVKDRDLLEDFQVDPLTDAEIEEWKTKRYSQDRIAQIPDKRQVKEVAQELSGDEDD